MSEIFDAKKFQIFRNILYFRTDKGEGRRTSYGQGGWSIFRDFVRTSFMDDPLAYWRS